MQSFTDGTADLGQFTHTEYNQDDDENKSYFRKTKSSKHYEILLPHKFRDIDVLLLSVFIIFYRSMPVRSGKVLFNFGYCGIKKATTQESIWKTAIMRSTERIKTKVNCAETLIVLGLEKVLTSMVPIRGIRITPYIT